jgi:L,D-transpeptidase ErfK/SrfK
VERTYGVATAKGGFVTPQGSWTVINKVMNPTWINPAPDTWGKDDPPMIPPGPGNPLGTRALYLNAPGIRIHGTYASSSIGSYASHGCIRMRIPDSEALYPLVPVGTPVLVHR